MKNLNLKVVRSLAKVTKTVIPSVTKKEPKENYFKSSGLPLKWVPLLFPGNSLI